PPGASPPAGPEQPRARWSTPGGAASGFTSVSQELLRSAELEVHLVVDKVVDPLDVPLDVHDQPLELDAGGFDVRRLEDLRAEDAEPGQQGVALPERGAAAGGQPAV